MMRIRKRHAVPSLLDQFLLERRRASRAMTSENDRNVSQVTIWEFMGAAMVLDLGGFPIEIPRIADAWPVDREQSNREQSK